MSPFAIQLKKIRIARKLQQNQLADIVGCEPSYVSALETDAKPPPQTDKLIHFLKKLNLSSEEEANLISTAKVSKRSIRLPLRGPTQLFEICHALEKKLPMLSLAQLGMIDLVLNVPPSKTEVLKM